MPKSPTISKIELIDFPAAIQAVKEGKKVTKQEWNDEKIHLVLYEGKVMITLKEKKGYILHPYIISEADLMGTDYYILP